MGEKQGLKRKAEEFDGKDPYVIYLIELIVQLQRENEQLHRQLEIVVKDVSEIKSLLLNKSESTNYTSVSTKETNSNKNNNNNNNNNNDVVMVEDDEEAKKKQEKEKEKDQM